MAGQLVEVDTLVNTLQGDALLASRQLTSFNPALSAPLPNNQAVLEMQHLFATGLAALQLQFQKLPTVTVSPTGAAPGTAPSSAAAMQTLCQAQKTRNAAYTTFSILGLSVVFSLGGFLILLGLFLPLVITLLQRRFSPTSYRVREWDAGHLFRIQQSAFQARNIGTWSNKMRAVPVTMPFEKITLPNVKRGKPRSGSDSETAVTSDVRALGSARYVALPPQQGHLSGAEDFERALLNPETQHRSLDARRDSAAEGGNLSGAEDFERALLSTETRHLSLEQRRESAADGT
jgi:hypothetical protein